MGQHTGERSTTPENCDDAAWPDPQVFRPEAVSEETQRFNAQFEETLAVLPKPFDLPVGQMRAARAEGRSIFPLAGPLEGSRWAEADAPGSPDAPDSAVALRLSEPEGPARGTYLHIHGGGWTLNAPEQYDAHCQRTARVAGCRVASVRYRLAPEHRWPACAEDVLSAALWALATERGPVVIGGESAGAHLAAVTLLRLREAGRLGRVAGAVLNYGMYDLSGTPSLRSWGPRYLVLSTPVVDWFVANLMGEDPRDGPDVSPLWANLAGLPPALFQVGTLDPLLDDTLFMAARWRAAGNGAALAVAPGGIHAFDQFNLAIAEEAHTRQNTFIAQRLAGA